MEKLHGRNHLQLPAMIRLLKDTAYTYKETKAYLEKNIDTFCYFCKGDE